MKIEIQREGQTLRGVLEGTTTVKTTGWQF